tara:strand:- start:61 stop:588 length:528 start_codon:yes stop_codon:yes gene_type:complete
VTQNTQQVEQNPSKSTPEANVRKSFLSGLVNQSGEVGKLAAALSKAQGELTGAKKSSTNPFFKSGYADLHEVIETVRPILAKNGLSVAQTTSGVEVIGKTAFLNVGTTLMHESGQWIRSYTPLPIETPVNCHKLGSAMTYGRRYGLAAMVGIAQMDDDGNAAIERGNSTQQTRRQ